MASLRGGYRLRSGGRGSGGDDGCGRACCGCGGVVCNQRTDSRPPTPPSRAPCIRGEYSAVVAAFWGGDGGVSVANMVVKL